MNKAFNSKSPKARAGLNRAFNTVTYQGNMVEYLTEASTLLAKLDAMGAGPDHESRFLVIVEGLPATQFASFRQMFFD